MLNRYFDHPNAAHPFAKARTAVDLDGEARFPRIDEKPVLWRNAFGEPVDLDNIDREYALNILSMVLMRRARRGALADMTVVEVDREVCADALVQKLREVILKDAVKTHADRVRARRYNKRARRAGLRWRASEA